MTRFLNGYAYGNPSNDNGINDIFVKCSCTIACSLKLHKASEDDRKKERKNRHEIMNS